MKSYFCLFLESKQSIFLLYKVSEINPHIIIIVKMRVIQYV